MVARYAAFIVNDREMSDVENAHIFDAKTLARLDLSERISATAGPDAAQFLKQRNDHSYFHAMRWIDAQHVEMQLYGHDLRFRVSRDGAVEKQSQRTGVLGSDTCEAMPQ